MTESNEQKLYQREMETGSFPFLTLCLSLVFDRIMRREWLGSPYRTERMRKSDGSRTLQHVRNEGNRVSWFHVISRHWLAIEHAYFELYKWELRLWNENEETTKYKISNNEFLYFVFSPCVFSIVGERAREHEESGRISHFARSRL